MPTPAELECYLTKRGFQVSVQALANGFMVVTRGQVAQISRALAETLEPGPFIIVLKRRNLWQRVLKLIHLS